jgi:hypothetical protein
MLTELEDWDTTSSEPNPSTSAGNPTLRQPLRVGLLLPKDLAGRKDVERGDADEAPVKEPPDGPRPAEEASDPADVPEPELSAPAHAPPEDGRIPYDPDGAPGPFRQWLRPVRQARQSTIIALSAATLSLVTGAWLVLRTPVAPRSTAVTSAASAPVHKSEPACHIERVAQRVSPRIFMPVAPIALEGTSSAEVALGFAETPTTAAGITIDPGALSVKFPFREPQTKKIVSVTPVHVGTKLTFVALREGIGLQQARALTGSGYTLFGVATPGVARQAAGQPPEILWPLESGTAVTDPRLALAFGLGHAVTFRQGGQNGSIQLAYLTESGHSLAPPTSVRTDATMLGTPNIGLYLPPSDEGVPTRGRSSASATPPAASIDDAGSHQEPRLLVTFAGRKSENEPWAVYLSTAGWRQSPNDAQVFALPEGGPGGDAISPSVASLMHGHWLLQWSEGPSGQRQVRVQLLDPSLRPLGKAHTVSPPDSNSGQGLLWTRGTRAVSFFVVSTGKLAELWASSLTCSK